MRIYFRIEPKVKPQFKRGDTKSGFNSLLLAKVEDIVNSEDYAEKLEQLLKEHDNINQT